MKQAVIVSTARTGLTKSYRGVFNETHGATMGGHVIEQAVKRAGIDASWIEDAFVGCGYPEGWTGSNIARQSVIRAGLPVSVSAATVNRFCSSGLQAVAMAALLEPEWKVSARCHPRARPSHMRAGSSTTSPSCICQ
jgi:acetyl-CoA C-acetyltransferase